jgi:hypothetical protein
MARGFNANRLDARGCHALHHLIVQIRSSDFGVYSHGRTLTQLLANGADVNRPDPRDGALRRTPIPTLASRITDDFSAMDTLLTAGADPSLYNI